MTGNPNICIDTLEQMGLDHKRIEHVRDCINREIEAGQIPGASLIIGRNGRRIHYQKGYAVHTSQVKQNVEQRTLYDCASLTKVIVTLPLTLMLIDEGKLHLNDSVAQFLPQFNTDEKKFITIKHLLTHTSGFIEFINLNKLNINRDNVIDAISHLPLLYKPSTNMVYSDLGYILLGKIIEVIFNDTLENIADSKLFKPLNMLETQFCPPDSLKNRIAATEFISEEGVHRWGSVHDENAQFMGGVSGHAGLFSTADDLANYAEFWLSQGTFNSTSILSKSAINQATLSYTTHLTPANRGLGWALKGDKLDASGDWLSNNCYGHTGFTGTSLWIDPTTNLYVVLLTNRVHYGRDKSVQRLRALVHNSVAASIVN